MISPAEPVPVTPAMSPERWRKVNAILEVALACEPERRETVIAEACEGDAALQAEVLSLLGAHGETGDDFLERPAAEAFGAVDAALGPSQRERLARALADRYAIEREIGRGGMATVYVARDLRHERRVAIKVLREEVAAAVGAERFLAEIRVTASLQHPHILPLFDSGSVDGCLWYAMPFVEGETLRARLRRDGRLPVAEAVRLAREVADALEHAHVRGIVHRDVKPENVLLRDGHAMVADFGIALAIEQAGGERITRTGLTLGTPQYMAPEQAAGARKLDARVDVYALGAVLHEMVAGETPFAAPSRQAVVQRLMHERPTALRARRPDVAPFIDAAVLKALAKIPEERFPSAAAFAAALAVPDAPPAAEVAAPRAPSRGRTVSARAALYAALGMLAIGLTAGRLLDPRALLDRLTNAASEAVQRVPDVRPMPAREAWGDAGLAIVDREGRTVQALDAERPWTPRFSPDGRQVVYGAFGEGRGSSDLWVTDLESRTTRRITDNDGDANDPQWSPDGRTIAFSVNMEGGKDVGLVGLGESDAFVRLGPLAGTQFPTDWLRDGSAILVMHGAGANGHDILVQPPDGSPAREYVATAADETTARASPDGRWVAYTSNTSGRPEVYLDSYPRPGRRVRLSSNGGRDPVWRADGRELFYWRDGALVAVPLGASTGAPPEPGAETVLFRAPYQEGLNTMYDVSPDGQRFVIVRRR